MSSVYDVTVAYRQRVPQNELDICLGRFPEEVHFLVKRYGQDELPTEESGEWQMVTSNYQSIGPNSRYQMFRHSVKSSLAKFGDAGFVVQVRSKILKSLCVIAM